MVEFLHSIPIWVWVLAAILIIAGFFVKKMEVFIMIVVVGLGIWVLSQNYACQLLK